ncbi:MAG: ankyrin repeat domain-containing protein [Rickettsiaceae bacterium H1]|nr:ankyrin repeat domain-containing protein [Rickettsiaceae bacterium H1]
MIKEQNSDSIVLLVWKNKVEELKIRLKGKTQEELNKPYKCGDDNQKNTLLNLAAIKGNSEIVNLLLTAGSNPAIIDKHKKQNSLHHGVLSDDINIVEKILATNESENIINVQDIYGNTPLFLAARNGNARIVSYLLAKGAKLSIENKFKQNPLDIATITGKY